MESLLSIDLEYDSKTKEIKAEKRNNGGIRIFRLHEKTCNSLIIYIENKDRRSSYSTSTAEWCVKTYLEFFFQYCRAFLDISLLSAKLES